jgi:hypothetical protein
MAEVGPAGSRADDEPRRHWQAQPVQRDEAVRLAADGV